MAIEYVYSPNWNDSYNISRGYNTSESISRMGIRQRGSLRQNSQVSFEFTSLLRGEKASQSLHVIKNNQNNIFYVPNWQVPRYVTDKNVSVFTTVTVVKGPDVLFEPVSVNDRICIWASDDEYAIGVVTQVTENTVDGVDYITYKVNSVLSWIEDFDDIYVYKIYSMIPQITASDWITDDILSLRINWNERVTTTYEPQVYNLPELACYPDGCFICDPVVLCPMYQDPADLFYSATSPAIFRGADLGLPDKIYLGIDTSKFSKDAAFADAGSLSNMLEALQKQFTLEYDDTVPNSISTSSHWHHLGYASPFFDLTPPLVDRYFWREIRNYTGNDGQPHQIEVRFVAEMPAGGIAANQALDVSTGAWGTLFHVYVFTDEMFPDFVEGDTYNLYPFYREDPAVYHNSERKTHPQLAIVAHIPTTIQKPVRYDRYDRYSVNDRVCYYNVGPAVPWTAGNPTNDISSSMFGYNRLQVISLAAGCTTSRLGSLITIENSEGSGLTALKTSAPGWDPVYGGLLSSSAITVRPRCTPQVDREDCCTGYARGTDNDELASPYTGSNNCWKSDYSERPCCFSKDSQIILDLADKCIQSTATYDEFCNVTDSTETVSATYSRQITLDVFSINYQIGGYGGDFIWKYREIDPTYVFRDYSDNFDDGLLGDMDPIIGTWDINTDGEAEILTTEDVDWEGAILLYNTETYSDVKVTVDVVDRDQPAGAVVHFNQPFAGLFSCFLGQINPLTGKMTIYQVINNVATVLKEEDYEVASLNDGYTMSFEARGGYLILTVPGYQVQVENCDAVSGGGKVGIGHKAGASILQSFDNLLIEDGDNSWVYAQVTFSGGGWTIAIDEKIMPGYGLCITPEQECDGVEVCGCTAIGRGLLAAPPGLPGGLLILSEPSCAFAFGNEQHTCYCPPEEQATGYPLEVVRARITNNSCYSGDDDGCTNFTYTLCTFIA